MKLQDVSYKTVVDSLHDGLYFVDRNRVITYWNKAAEEISGFSAAEVVGRSCAEIDVVSPAVRSKTPRSASGRFGFAG